MRALIAWTIRRWPFLALVASAALLAIAHAFQTFEHLEPCELCLKEREVYWVALPIAAVACAVSLSSLRGRWLRPLEAILALVFLFGAGLAAYHAGVEWKWWPGPTTCTGAGKVNIAELTALIHGATEKAPACDKAAWVFLGLSMAGWNCLISLKLAFWSAVAAVRGAAGAARVR